MKPIWFGFAKYGSDAYLQREDVARWEIWMGRYLVLEAVALLIWYLFDLPLMALIVLLVMLLASSVILFIHSLFRFVVNGEPVWIATWYILKYTGIFWLYWKLIFEKQVQGELANLDEFKEEDRFTHRGKDWVWLATGRPKYKHALVTVEPGHEVRIPEPVPAVTDEGDSCST